MTFKVLAPRFSSKPVESGRRGPEIVLRYQVEETWTWPPRTATASRSAGVWLIAKPSASKRASAQAACLARSRPGRPARSAISVGVDGSDLGVARKYGRMSRRGQAPRGDGAIGMLLTSHPRT